MSTIRRFSSGGPWEESLGYSRAVRAGGWLHVSGCTATVDGVVTHVGDAYGQMLTALEVALRAVAEAGGAAANVVRTRMYVTHLDHAEPAGRAHGEVFRAARPASTLLVVAGLWHPDHLVEVEVEAFLG